MQVDDFLTWATLGVVLGGRLGYVLFYQPGRFLAHPWQILEVWQRRHELPRRHAGRGDRDRLVLPPQQAFRSSGSPTASRWRRRSGWASAASPTSSMASCGAAPAPDWLPWAMIFPARRRRCRAIRARSIRRCWKGVLLFVVMLLLARREALRARFGMLTGVFLSATRVARIIGEFFREPDAVPGLPVRRRHHGPVAVACRCCWPGLVADRRAHGRPCARA